MNNDFHMNIECEYTEWGAKLTYSAVTLDDRNYLEFVEFVGKYKSKLGVRLVLVDARQIRRNVSLGKLHEVVAVCDSAGIIGKRLAIVSSPETDKNGSEFLCDAGANRGLLLQFFLDESEALAWLLE